MGNQAKEAALLMEEAIDKMCGDLPTEIDEETAAKIEATVARIKSNRERRKTQKIPEGQYFANPMSKSTYLKDLRDLLLIFKRVVIPMKVREELSKLKVITAIAFQAADVDPAELNAELAKANLAGKEQMETIQQMAKMVGNLANG